MHPPQKYLRANSLFPCFQAAKMPTRRDVLIMGIVFLALAMVAVSFYTLGHPSSSVAILLGGKVGTYVLSTLGSGILIAVFLLYLRSLYKGSKKHRQEQPPIIKNQTSHSNGLHKDEKPKKIEDRVPPDEKVEKGETDAVTLRESTIIYDGVETFSEKETKLNQSDSSNGSSKSLLYSSIEIKEIEEENSPSLNGSTNHKANESKKKNQLPRGKKKLERLKNKRVSLERSGSFSLVIETTKNKKEINETLLDLPWEKELEEEIKRRDGIEEFNAATFSQQMSKILEEKKKEFIKNALDVFENKKMPSPSSFEKLKLDEEQLKILKEDVIPVLHKKKFPKDSRMTSHKAKEHIVFEHEDIKGLIFKVEREDENFKEEKFVQEYIKLREKAREYCKQNNLYLIQIPASTYIKINDYFVVIEEKIEDLFGETDFQRGFFQWGLAQPELQSYFYELFTEGIKYICGNKYSDVKHNNIPLSIIYGRLVLVDLDNEGAIAGLVRGLAEHAIGNGLLNYIPEKWQNDFIKLAKENLSQDECKDLDRWLNGFVENGKSIKSIPFRVKKTEEKRKAHAEYLSKRSITSFSSPITYDENATRSAIQAITKKESHKIIHEDVILAIAERFIKEINKTLILSANFDLMNGRRVEIDLTSSGMIWLSLKDKNIFSKFNRTFYKKEDEKPDFQSCIRPTLLVLQEAGLIHRFSYITDFQCAQNGRSATIWV